MTGFISLAPMYTEGELYIMIRQCNQNLSVNMHCNVVIPGDNIKLLVQGRHVN